MYKQNLIISVNNYVLTTLNILEWFKMDDEKNTNVYVSGMICFNFGNI